MRQLCYISNLRDNEKDTRLKIAATVELNCVDSWMTSNPPNLFPFEGGHSEGGQQESSFPRLIK